MIKSTPPTDHLMNSLSSKKKKKQGVQNEIGHVFFNFKDNYNNFVIAIVFLSCNFIVYKRSAQELPCCVVVSQKILL